MEKFSIFRADQGAVRQRDRVAGRRLVRAQGCRKALVHYGGGSAVRSGLLDRIYASLKGGRRGLCLPRRRGAQSPPFQGV